MTSERYGSGWVIDAIRTSITSGDLQPNQRLIEMDLAEQFGVGRAAIRTALLELSKEGLVERPQNRGARVRLVSLEEAIEITEARMVNEGLCAAKAAERATDKELEELRCLIDQMRERLADGDHTGYSNINPLLHKAIRDMSRQAIVAEIIEQLRNRGFRHRIRLAFVPGRPQVSVEEHAVIVEAICARDPEAARAAMEQHLRGVVETLQRQPPEVWL